jgi:ribonuclease PH
MAYVVKRQTGRFEDYLIGFDVIWGPIWCINDKGALRFPSISKADVALFDAADIMRPKAWCVPDYGAATTLWVEEAR